MSNIKTDIRKPVQGAIVLAGALLMMLFVYTSELRAQSPGAWNGASATSPGPTPFSTYSLNNAIGIGTKNPGAWQEIQFCAPVSGLGTPGLIVTYDNTCDNLLPPLNQGEIDSLAKTGGAGSSPGIKNIFFPYSFLTGHNTNVVQPLFQTMASPLFWARVQNGKLLNNNQGTREYDTKMIVMPEGKVGINLANPRAALDVRGIQGINNPSAIFGSMASGTVHDLSNGLYNYYTQQVHFVPFLSDNGYNRIAVLNDQGMFFTDGKGINGANQDGAFVLAPWSQENDASAVGGLRMDKFGNVEFHGHVRATQIKVQAQWWSDNVFQHGYRLPTLYELESYINKQGHLPGVPAESQILEHGIGVSDMFAIHMQKIEELTLYIIQQQKQIDELKEAVESLK